MSPLRRVNPLRAEWLRKKPCPACLRGFHSECPDEFVSEKYDDEKMDCVCAENGHEPPPYPGAQVAPMRSLREQCPSRRAFARCAITVGHRRTLVVRESIAELPRSVQTALDSGRQDPPPSLSR
jgi:hypothetical protein